jgi:hypothetical protein
VLMYCIYKELLSQYFVSTDRNQGLVLMYTITTCVFSLVCTSRKQLT